VFVLIEIVSFCLVMKTVNIQTLINSIIVACLRFKLIPQQWYVVNKSSSSRASVLGLGLGLGAVFTIGIEFDFRLAK